jgi:hypothetical protein
LGDPVPWRRSEFDLGKRFIDQHRLEARWYFVAGRWACLPFAAVGGVVCFVWARRLYGGTAGLAAVILWGSSPNILAHAQLITPDAAAAALGAWACLAFWGWLQAPSWPRAAYLGLALGLALLTKFTLLVLGPLWLALWGARALRAPRSLVREGPQLGCAFLLALSVLNLGYGFEKSFVRLGDFQFVSQDLAGHRTDPWGKPQFGNRFAGTWVTGVPVPLPANYLMGIDVQRRELEHGYNSYLRGEWRKQGWWYYYLYGLLVKEPVGTLALAALAAGTVALRRPAARPSGELVPLVCAVGILALVSSQTGFNHHLRYVLPALPLGYVWMSRVFAPGRPQWVAAVGACCVVGSAASSLWYYPHSMSYFNQLAGGPAAGPRHLHNSNVDWGQDLLYLKEWCDRHPDRRPLYVVYSGSYSSASLVGWDEGVHHGAEPSTRQALLSGSGPCWYALFVGRLNDPPEEPDVFARFRGREPDERIAYTIYIYHDVGPGGR